MDFKVGDKVLIVHIPGCSTKYDGVKAVIKTVYDGYPYFKYLIQTKDNQTWFVSNHDIIPAPNMESNIVNDVTTLKSTALEGLKTSTICVNDLDTSSLIADTGRLSNGFCISEKSQKDDYGYIKAPSEPPSYSNPVKIKKENIKFNFKI